MSTTTLDKFDFESTHNYMGELGKHIADETDGKMRLISIIVDVENHQMCTSSKLPKSRMFSLLLMSLLKVTPSKFDKIKENESGSDIISRMMDAIEANE